MQSIEENRRGGAVEDCDTHAAHAGRVILFARRVSEHSKNPHLHAYNRHYKLLTEPTDSF